MKEVFARIYSRSKQLAQNPLFTEWLENDAIPPEQKFVFTPMALDFIMGFRDFNKYYVWYPEPKNEYEKAINDHSLEDETHSALLLKDWAVLGLDQQLGWEGRHLYWWLTCAETEEARRADFELMKMTWENPDAFFRFAIVESMEAAGNVFFTRTVKTADILEKKLGKELPYFGKYHLDRETGHLQGGDERIFIRTKLTPEQHAHAFKLIDRVFDIFELHFTTWNKLAHRIQDKTFDFNAEKQGREKSGILPYRPLDVRACLHLDYPPQLTGVNRELFDERNKAFDDLWKTPFYTWVRDTMHGEFRRMVRYFFLQWVVDDWACADYFLFDTPYAEAKTPLERGVNRLSILYGAEMNRRYVEWELYQLDEFTGWGTAEALRHYWLDEFVEGQRKVFADLRKLTFKYPQPLYRYWIMKCFGQFGEALAHSMGHAMKFSNEKDEDFVTLAGYPERLHPALPDDPEADMAIAALEQQPLTPEDVRIIREIIVELRDQEAERSRLSWEVVQQKRYERLDTKWQTGRHVRHKTSDAVGQVDAVG